MAYWNLAPCLKQGPRFETYVCSSAAVQPHCATILQCHWMGHGCYGFNAASPMLTRVTMNTLHYITCSTQPGIHCLRRWDVTSTGNESLKSQLLALPSSRTQPWSAPWLQWLRAPLPAVLPKWSSGAETTHPRW
jgi:hypothetical protein